MYKSIQHVWNELLLLFFFFQDCFLKASQLFVFMTLSLLNQRWSRWTANPTSHCPKWNMKWISLTQVPQTKVRMVGSKGNPMTPEKLWMNIAKSWDSTTTVTAEKEKPLTSPRKVNNFFFLLIMVITPWLCTMKQYQELSKHFVLKGL